MLVPVHKHPVLKALLMLYKRLLFGDPKERRVTKRLTLNIFLKVVNFNNPHSKAHKCNLAKHLVLNLFLKLKQAGHNQEQHTGGESSQPRGADKHPWKQKGRRPGQLGAVPFQQAQDKAGGCLGLSEGSDNSFWAQVNRIPTSPCCSHPDTTSSKLEVADWTCPVWLGQQRWSLW